MKAQIKTGLIFCSFLLMISCEQNERPHIDISNLSTDSLRILQTNIPVNHYTDLTFTDKSCGFAITNSGDIIKTTDGGYSWEELSSPVNFFLSKIQFTDDNTGYIIGGDDTGGYLLKTDDSGRTWQLTDLQTPDNERPTGMTFISKETGYISGRKLFRKTYDGGITWIEVLDNLSENINDISFKNSVEGYAASDKGKYYKTIDGGKTWNLLQANTSENLEKVYFAGSGTYAKCQTSIFVDLVTGNSAFTVPQGALNFLFIDENRSIGIGQHYENGFLPYGDIFLTNDAWETFNQKKYNPQSEALNVTAIAKENDGKVVMLGSGTINSSVIILQY